MDEQFKKFMDGFGKKYEGSDELKMRKEIYKKNYLRVENEGGASIMKLN